MEFENKKKDPCQWQVDEVVNWKVQPSVSQRGAPQHMITVLTPYRSFRYWVQLAPAFSLGKTALRKYRELEGQPPRTIMYRKNPDNGFYEVHAYNLRHDEAPK